MYNLTKLFYIYAMEYYLAIKSYKALVHYKWMLKLFCDIKEIRDRKFCIILLNSYEMLIPGKSGETESTLVVSRNWDRMKTDC